MTPGRLPALPRRIHRWPISPGAVFASFSSSLASSQRPSGARRFHDHERPAAGCAPDVEHSADARQPLGATDQAQAAAVPGGPRLLQAEADAVVLNRDPDPTIGVFDTNARAIRGRVPDDVGDRFFDHVGDLAQGPGRDPVLDPFLSPAQAALRPAQQRVGKGARPFQWTDSPFQMPEPKGEGPRAIEGVAGRLLQHFQRFGAGVALGDRTAYLLQQRAERLANPVMDLAGELLAFNCELALTASLSQALIFESAGDAQDVRDPIRHQFEDGDPFQRQRLAAGAALL